MQTREVVANTALMAQLQFDPARSAMHYVAPVGEKELYIERMPQNVTPYLDEPAGPIE